MANNLMINASQPVVEKTGYATRPWYLFFQEVSTILQGLVINLATQVSGILGVGNGGTGDSTLQAHAVLIGNGTSPILTAAPGAAGTVLTSNGVGVDPTFQANANGDVVGPASAVDSQIALYDGTTGKLIKAASGTGVVHATSGVYSVATVDLASEVTGRLPYANLTAAAAASTLLGRESGSVGDWEQITLGAGLSMSGTTLNATGSGGGTVTTTGSPASGNLTTFSGASSITNGDLSGDVTTSGTLVATLKAALKTRPPSFTFSGSSLAATKFYDIYFNYACTITAVTVMGDVSGSAVFDLLTSTGFNSTPSSSIVASAPPTLSSAIGSQDTTLTGWTTAVAANTRMRCTVTSTSGLTWASVTLTVSV